MLRFVFNLARKWGIPGSAENPTAGLKTAPDVCRERFLAREEVQRLLTALDTDENRVMAFAIKLLLLTDARRNEVTHAKWEHVNWNRRPLLLPRAKSGRLRSIYLNSSPLDCCAPSNGQMAIRLSFLRRSPDGHHCRWISRGGGFANPPAGSMCGCTIYGIRSRASSQTKTHRYMWCKAYWGTRKRTRPTAIHLANDTLADAAEVMRDVILEPPDDGATSRSQTSAPTYSPDHSVRSFRIRRSAVPETRLQPL